MKLPPPPDRWTIDIANAERAMLLDAVLDEPTCTWLGPALDKRRYFIRRDHGRVECIEGSRQYLHLSPLVDVA